MLSIFYLQEQKEREKQRLMQEMPPPMSPIMKKKLSPPTTLQLSQPDIIHSSELVREALRESMLSFQETLDQYKEEAGDISDFDLISGGITSTPATKMKCPKYSTFPRQNLGSPNDDIPLGKLSRQMSNSSISSISTSSSADVFSPVLGNIFLRAGGVTTRGMKDLLSARGEVGLEVFGVAPGVFLCILGENFGMRLFLSAEAVE